VGTLVNLLGCGLMAEGVLGLGVAISLVKIVKNQMPDVVTDQPGSISQKV
jgi:hypothetical protein